MSTGQEWVAIQHVPYEGPGLIAAETIRRETPLRICRPYRGDPLPVSQDLRGLVVMGGPMGVADTAEHPYLADELELLAAMAAAGKPVLGVCLGAQLLAAALGARVYRGERPELGPGAVSLTAEGHADPVLSSAASAVLTASPEDDTLAPAAADGELPVIHWHQDTFELPSGAVWLARSALYPHQAFRAGEHAYGLQFHVEVNRELAADWRTRLQADVELTERTCIPVERAGRAAIAAFFDLAERSYM